jgi:glycosyltransferase involved in cell wall biosynthesis
MTPSEDGRTAAGGVRPDPSMMGRWARHYFGWKPACAAWLAQHARRENFDVAVITGVSWGQYVAYCRVPAVWDVADDPVLYALRDTEHGPWHRWPSALRHAAFCAAYERAVARRAAVTLFVSTIDAGYARRWCGDACLAVTQNGVDFDYFRPAPPAPPDGTVAFVGAFDFPPNIDGAVHFVRHAWPRVHERGRQRRLMLVGRDPDPRVCELTKLPGVELAANVPDVRPYLEQATVVIVPTRKGGGQKNKVLEACAVRRPLVASHRALGGLSARPGRDLLAATRIDTWVEQIERLLTNPVYAQAIAENGCRWVQRDYSWETAARNWLNVLASTAGIDHGTALPPASNALPPRGTREPAHEPAPSRSIREPEVAACL